MDFIKHLSEHNLWYLPIIIGCLLLFAGFLNGFFRGWKSSLYFMIWNIVGFYVALLVLDAIYDSVLKGMAKNWFSSIASSLGDKAFDDFFTLFHGWLVLMMVLLVLSFWNFIAWIVHFFFKKRFQKHLKDNKAAGKSNAGSRLLGGFFGIIAVVPTSASAMASSTVVSTNEGVNEATDKIVNAFTFGKVNNISSDWDAIYGLVLSAQSAQDLTLMMKGAIADVSDMQNIMDNGIVKNAPSIIRMFNNEKSAKIASDVISYQVTKIVYAGGGAFKPQPIDKKLVDDIATNFPEIKGIFSGLNDTGKAAFNAIFEAGDDFKNLLTTPVVKP